MDQELSAARIREQLDRLQRSPVFEKSDRLMSFLRHIVEAVLRGDARHLTESGVGNAVYGRTREYDARIDSTVRVEARRLRRKLNEYYAGPGLRDDVSISLPVGSYIPVIGYVDHAARDRLAAPASGADSPPIFQKGAGAALAVLPLRALGGAHGEESFAEGLTDELMFSLARSPGLRVVSRSAIAQALRLNLSLPALATELAVDAILQGTVRSDGLRMRVMLEVADPKGFVVWSDRIDLPEGERMPLQELTAATILSRVRFDSSQMRARAIGPGPNAIDALAKVYSARQLLDEQTPASLGQALELFGQVASSAPDYARGHSGVADCYCDMYRLGLIDQASARNTARAAVTCALSIDPQSIEARAALGTVCGWLDWNRFEAEEHLRAVLRGGESSRAARSYGVLLTILGRHEEAEHLLWEARQMEPYSIQQDIAETLSRYQSRRFGDAIQTLASVPSSRVPLEALVYVALSHVFLGDETGARTALGRINRHIARYPDLRFAQAEIEAWIGNPAAASGLLAGNLAESTAFARATLAASVRDEERVLEFAGQAIAKRELSAVWLRSDARFDRFRGTPRFEALVAELDRLSVDRFGASNAAR